MVHLALPYSPDLSPTDFLFPELNYSLKRFDAIEEMKQKSLKGQEMAPPLK